jgi:cell wall assembly regulator SMI1
MTSLEGLFNEINTRLTSEPCLDAGEIDRFDERNGYRLPSDLKSFYRKYKSVKLFDGKYGPTYRFVPIIEIHRTRIDIYGEDSDEWGPRAWLTICDVADGNYIAIDLMSKNNDQFNFIDCFHETFAQPGECQIVAKSFTELLDQALHGGKELFFLQKGFVGYGDGMPLTAENASIRIENPEAPRKGWLVKFSTAHTSFNEFFADKEYGGKEKSFEAVKRFIEEKKAL